MTERANAENAHLSPEAIVRYIEETAAPQDRWRMERHLAECEACLDEVLESRRLLEGDGA
jgi:anti-sigma factor RsiW